MTCLQLSHRRGGPWLFAAAGALFGIAILARPTQLALLPIFAAAFWLLPVWRRRALAFAGGVVTPILAEAAVYAVWVGDALFPWRLSAAHTRIPSTELEKSVDLTQSPLFNIDYIDGWIPSMGISVHWTVDGLINLLAHPAIGLTFAAAIMLLGLGHRWLRSPDPHARLFLFLIGASALFFGALVYGFAIDPKPRMFLPVLAVAAAAFGVLAAERMRRRDMLLVTVCLCLMAGKAVISSWDRLKVDSTAAIAANWARDEPGAIALAPLTSALLTLTPELRDLPVGKDARPKLMLLGGGTCARSIQEEFAGWQVLREHRYGLEENALVSRLREARIFFQPRQVIVLCLITKPA